LKIYNPNGAILKKELELILDAEHNENVDLDLTTNSKGKGNFNFAIFFKSSFFKTSKSF
jgi:hypothetical protein